MLGASELVAIVAMRASKQVSGLGLSELSVQHVVPLPS